MECRPDGPPSKHVDTMNPDRLYAGAPVLFLPEIGGSPPVKTGVAARSRQCSRVADDVRRRKERAADSAASLPRQLRGFLRSHGALVRSLPSQPDGTSGSTRELHELG